MKRSWIKRTSTKLSAHSKKLLDYNSPEATKARIQTLLRDYVIARDGGCFFRHILGHICSGYANDGHLILQADHLITRANSSTYADPRLVVCVCKGIHGWKSVGSNANKQEYDRLLRTILPPDRIALWDKAEADRYTPHRRYATDWLLEEAALRAQLQKLIYPRHGFRP